MARVSLGGSLFSASEPTSRRLEVHAQADGQLGFRRLDFVFQGSAPNFTAPRPGRHGIRRREWGRVALSIIVRASRNEHRFLIPGHQSLLHRRMCALQSGHGR